MTRSAPPGESFARVEAMDLLTEWERHANAPIRSLHDREAFVFLGRRNPVVLEDDGGTVEWALDAVLDEVAEAATDEDRARILAWVREGEAQRPR